MASGRQIPWETPSARHSDPAQGPANPDDQADDEKPTQSPLSRHDHPRRWTRTLIDSNPDPRSGCSRHRVLVLATQSLGYFRFWSKAAIRYPQGSISRRLYSVQDTPDLFRSVSSEVQVTSHPGTRLLFPSHHVRSRADSGNSPPWSTSFKSSHPSHCQQSLRPWQAGRHFSQQAPARIHVHLARSSPMPWPPRRLSQICQGRAGECQEEHRLDERRGRGRLGRSTQQWLQK